MTTSGWLQIVLYAVVLIACAKPLGAYMAAVYEGRARRAQRIGGPLERLIYRGAGVDPNRDMTWIDYALGALAGTHRLCPPEVVAALIFDPIDDVGGDFETPVCKYGVAARHLQRGDIACSKGHGQVGRMQLGVKSES